MISKYSIQVNGWAGWLEVPAATPAWVASPVRIIDVVPLKTGQGKLVLNFIQPLSPGGGRRRRIELKVIQHGSEHLVGSMLDEDGAVRTAVVSCISFEWLASYGPGFFDRRPPRAATMMIDGVPAWENTPQMHLDRVLGRSTISCLAPAPGASVSSSTQCRHGGPPSCWTSPVRFSTPL